MSMTNRQRLLCTLQCQRCDRPPLPWWMGFQPWGQTLRRWRSETGIADLRPEACFGFERFFLRVLPDRFGPWPHFEKTILSEQAEFVVSTDYRGITCRSPRDGSMPEWIHHPIQGREDWTRYKRERLQLRLDERLAGLEAFLDGARGVDAPLQVGAYPWGVFGTARDLLGAEGILLTFYDDPDLVRDILETYTSLWLALYERISRRAQIDHIHLWEDMSGRQGSLLSPAMIDAFLMPPYDRIADFAKRRGVPVFSVDSDGRVDELVPLMIRHGVNAFLPFEAQAGSDVEGYGRQYPRLGLLGGLDKRALAQGRPQMHRELERASRLLARGGWVPGFDHLIPPDVPWENYRYFLANLQRMVGL